MSSVGQNVDRAQLSIDTASEMPSQGDGVESHRSLHVFQSVKGSWQVVASGSTPIVK